MMRNLCDVITESLKSYDGNKLADKIKQLAPDLDVYYKADSHTISIDNYYKRDASAVTLLQNKRFLQLLDLYGWQIHAQFEDENRKYSAIEIEPKNNNDVTDWVFKKCGGICYHFTMKENVKKILQTGLRPKDTYSTRTIKNNTTASSRVYMVAKEDYKSLDAYDLQFLDDYAEHNSIKNWGCIRVDLNKLGRISLFEDHNTDWQNKDYKKAKAIYCNVSIPAKCLEEYDIFSITQGKSATRYLSDKQNEMMKDYRQNIKS